MGDSCAKFHWLHLHDAENPLMKMSENLYPAVTSTFRWCTHAPWHPQKHHSPVQNYLRKHEGSHQQGAEDHLFVVAVRVRLRWELLLNCWCIIWDSRSFILQDDSVHVPTFTGCSRQARKKQPSNRLERKSNLEGNIINAIGATSVSSSTTPFFIARFPKADIRNSFDNSTILLLH